MIDNKSIDELIHWDENSSDDLYHWGIKGMKWGQRRYQNKDGSLTAAGKSRYNDGESGASKLGKKIKEAHNAKKASKAQKKQASKSVKDLTDAELNDRIKRLNAERQALDLERQISGMSPKHVSAGKAFISTAASQVLKPALINAGKDVLTNFLKKKGMDIAGLGEAVDALSGLKDKVAELNLKKQKDELDRYFNNKSANSNDYLDGDFSKYTDSQIADAATRQKNINIIKNGRKSNDNGSSTPKNNGDSSESKNTDVSSSNDKATSGSSSKYTPTKFSGKYTTVKRSAEAPKKEFQVSNSNARPVHDIYEKYYKRSTGTVESLYKSGYMMTPLSKLEGTSPSRNVSNRSAYLTDVGNWKMRSLEDMERFI